MSKPGLELVEIIVHEPHTLGGVHYGGHTAIMRFPKLPWYKRIWYRLEEWWLS